MMLTRSPEPMTTDATQPLRRPGLNRQLRPLTIGFGALVVVYGMALSFAAGAALVQAGGPSLAGLNPLRAGAPASDSVRVQIAATTVEDRRALVAEYAASLAEFKSALPASPEPPASISMLRKSGAERAYRSSLCSSASTQ